MIRILNISRLRWSFFKAAISVFFIFIFFHGDIYSQVGITYPKDKHGFFFISPSLIDQAKAPVSAQIREYFSGTHNPYIEVKSKIDSLSGNIIVEEGYRGSDFIEPIVMNPDSFNVYYARKSMNKKFSGAFSTPMSEGGKGGIQRKGLNITVPVPIESEAFRRVFGEGVGLAVNGNVYIKGGFGHQSRSAVRAVRQGSNYSFKLEQTQKFTIQGKIGNLIDVKIDQDSERGFEFENNLKLRFDGKEDEIFQLIEAGNIGLSLPGTRFVTFSGSNQGLFGLKTISKLGNFNLTTIASLEKGKKQKLSIKGGESSESKVIKDYNYVRGVYFFLDDYYLENYTFNRDGILEADPNKRIVEIEVWKAGPNYNLKPEAREAWACFDPANPDTLQGGDANNVRGYFMRLVKDTDYFLQENMGYIIMNQTVNDEILAVAYRTEDGEVHGDISPSPQGSFILKLIRTKRPFPSDKTWPLEMKNVYYLGGRNLSTDGLEVSIVYNKSNTRDKVYKNGKNYLEIFGLDRRQDNGSPGADDKADVDNPNIFNLSRGELIMPSVRPFDFETDPFTDAATELDKSYRTPEIYDTLFVNPNDYNRFSKFDIEVKSSSAQSSYSLGLNVLPNSEEINLNGTPLTKGVDYEIDYDFGTLTILNENALRPGADLDIKYESSEIFQVDRKTLFGGRLVYDFWENSFIGITGLYLGEKVLEQRVNIGQEPVRNFVWDINTKFDFDSDMLTSALDKLPLVEATQPSHFKFEGEFAQIRPNSNTMNNPETGDRNGVAFLDDFEGSKRSTILGPMRRQWVLSSVPVGKNKLHRGRLLWYNPFNKISIKELFPNKDVNARTQQTINVLNLKLYQPPFHSVPSDSLWGGIMRWMTTGLSNQTESKFVDVWVKGQKGTIHIDLGLISEDIIPNGKLDTEEKGIPNNILDEGEDTGLDGIAGKDGESDREREFELLWGYPAYDDWKYSEGSTDYDKTNGTEGNGTGERIDGSKVPDTEDLNRDGNLNGRNDYFTFSFTLGDNAEDSKYIAGGKDNLSGWRLYRIPLNEFNPGDTNQNPDLSMIEFARLWVEGIEGENEEISIYQIELTGNDWKDLGIAISDTLSLQGKFTKNDSVVSVKVINTEENSATYKSPPGVKGLEDRITRARAREQSLLIRFENLKPGNSGAIQKTFYEDKNLVHYEELKMFIHGPERVGTDSLQAEIFLRFGKDINNYYEYRAPLFTGWDERNNVEINLRDLSRVRVDSPGKIKRLEGGKILRVVGQPTLTQIRQIFFGLKNTSEISNFTGDVWLDEMRVSEVESVKGFALRAQASLQLSDVMTVSGQIEKRHADFRTVNEKFGSGDNSLNLSFSTNFNIGRLVSPDISWNIPVSFNYANSESNPKYMAGSDILFTKELPDSLYNMQIKKNEQMSFSTSLQKAKKSKNWLLANTLDLINLKFGGTRTSSRDYNTEVNELMSYSGSFNYGVSFGKRSIKPFSWLGSAPVINKLSGVEFFYLPTRFQANADVRLSESKTKQRRGTMKYVPKLDVNRGFSTALSPLRNLTIDFTKTYVNDLRNSDKSDLLKFFLHDTTAVSTSQAMKTSFRPQIFSWLGNNFTYNTTYNLNHNIGMRTAGKTAVLDRSFSGDFNFSLAQFFGSFRRQKTQETKTAPRPAPRIRPGSLRKDDEEKKDEEKKEQKQEDEKGGGFSIFGTLESFGKFFNPFSLRYNSSSKITAVGLAEAPTTAFQFGFSDTTGVPQKMNVGSSLTSSNSKNQFSLSSGFNLFNSIAVNFNYDVSKTTVITGKSETGTSEQTFFPMGDDPEESGIPFPSWSLKWSGLQKLPILENIFTSLSLDHAFSGKRSEQNQGAALEGSDLSFSKGFSPLIRLTMNWKWGFTSSFVYNKTETLQKYAKNESLSRTRGSDISFQTDYSKTGGFKIPIPIWPFNNKEIKNSVTFSFLFSKKTNLAERTDETGKFVAFQKMESLNIKPKISYTFSSKVTGGIFFDYIKSSNIQVGDNSTKDFGFDVRITIAGN